MQPIFYLFMLGVCVGGNANFMFRIWGKANLAFFDTNICWYR